MVESSQCALLIRFESERFHRWNSGLGINLEPIDGGCNLTAGNQSLSMCRLHPPWGSVWGPGCRDRISTELDDCCRSLSSAACGCCAVYRNALAAVRAVPTMCIGAPWHVAMVAQALVVFEHKIEHTHIPFVH